MIIVMDGVGVGELPDAAVFGDSGSCTLGNLAAKVGGLHLPHLGKLGLGNIISIEGVPPADEPQAAYGRMAMQSPGKDSTSGHWEMAGLILTNPCRVHRHRRLTGCRASPQHKSCPLL